MGYYRIYTSSISNKKINLVDSNNWDVISYACIIILYQGQTSIIESIDQDGDSYDWDGDGYSIAQELQYGTNPNDADDYPDVPALPLSNWVDEDDFSYSMDGENCQRNIYGIQTEGICQINVDDDGDCERLDWVYRINY